MNAAEPILVWGAGAIGGTIGAALVRARHAVVFVDIEADHVAAIADQRKAEELRVGNAPQVLVDLGGRMQVWQLRAHASFSGNAFDCCTAFGSCRVSGSISCSSMNVPTALASGCSGAPSCTVARTKAMWCVTR